MKDNEKPSAFMRAQAVALFLGWIPALFLGFLVARWTLAIGDRGQVGSLLLRGCVCGLPVIVLARMIPRAWIIPSAIYLVTFCCSYGWMESLVGWMLVGFGGRNSQGVTTLQVPEHPELPWYSVVTSVLAAVTAIVRLRELKKAEADDWQANHG